MSVLRFLLAALVVLPGSLVRALPLESNHGALQTVPAKGTVNIDGVVDEAEWDLSGEMFVYGVSKLRERYSARVYGMWDAGAFYLAIKWRDPTPMINNVDPDTDPQNGWMSDSFQARFTTDWSQIHFTAWYSSFKDKGTVDIRYDGPLNPAGAFIRTTPGKVMKTAEGFEMAFKADGDNRGYVQEMKIPWKLLFKNAAVQAGAKFRFSGEFFWGGPSGTKWPAVMWADPINLASPQRIVLYQNPNNWGECVLLPQGNLPKAVEEENDLRLQGPVPIRFAVPADATHFSLAIDDAQGTRVRNLASHQRVSDYVVKREGNAKIVEVPWDGRAEGGWDKARSQFLGDYAKSGKYAARVIVHGGLNVLYAGSFYNPGTPPWATADMSGDWGFDHSPPTTIAAIGKASASAGRLFIGFPVGENGVGLIGLNAEGRKIWSWVRHGAGASLLATNDKNFIYYAAGGNDQMVLGRGNPDNGQNAPLGNGAPEIVVDKGATGMAARGETVVLAFGAANRVSQYDLASGAKVKDIVVDKPGSIAFAPDGALVGISGTQFFRVDLATGSVQPFSLSGVAEPRTVAFDATGACYVADARDSNVKVYAAAQNAANPVRTIGEPGGHRPGPWNPGRMNTPGSMAIEERADGKRQLWCTEGSNHPRRVSVWDESGKLVRDYLGNTNYSGHGGLMSDNDPTRGVFVGYGVGLIFQVDYANYDYKLVEIMGGQPDAQPGKVSLFGLSANPSGGLHFGNGVMFNSDISGRKVEYFCEGYGGVCTVFMKRGDRWLCVAALGSRSIFPQWPAELPAAPNPQAVFSWSDLNKDGFQQADEITWFNPGEGYPNILRGGWGYQPDRSLTWYHSGWAFKPVRFTDDGAPIYEASKAERLPGQLSADQQKQPAEIYKTKFGYVTDSSDGQIVDKNNVVHGLHWYTGYDNAGNLRWKYPNYWLSVHGAMTAPMAIPGVIMGSLKTSGIVRMGDHDVISIRGNIGQEFLLRDDGMYLGELFTDQRMAPSSFPPDESIAGVPINDMTIGGEPFNGWIARQDDGKVRMTFGNTDVRIAEVTGLDKVTDLPPVTIELTEPLLAECRNFVPRKGGGQRVTKIDIARGGPFAPDLKLFDVPEAMVIRSGREEVGKALLRYDDTNLYVAFSASDATPLKNTGTVAPLAFKTGDSVNLFIAPEAQYADGDISGTRVLLADMSGKPTSVVYKPRGAGKEYVFESPVRKSTFGYVAEDPRVTFQAAAIPGKAFALSATIPWAVLDVQPRPGLVLRCDLGLLFSDDNGTRTDQRIHWVDEQTGVVNDVPTEAEFFPARWGTITLR